MSTIFGEGEEKLFSEKLASDPTCKDILLKLQRDVCDNYFKDPTTPWGGPTEVPLDLLYEAQSASDLIRDSKGHELPLRKDAVAGIRGR